MADPDLMRQVLLNLSGNAVKYTPDGGSIAFQLRREGAAIKFTLSNSGNGITPPDKEKVFQRFYRADKSRSRKTEGAGLGLNLSREIVRAHHGDLALEEASDQRISFAMTLPIVT
jgi:signal transduction histidine kinase